MKKMKFTQKVALLLLFACLFTLFAGCTTPTNPTIETNPVLFGGLTKFNARPYGHFGALSSTYMLDTKVEDGKVCINDNLYNVTLCSGSIVVKYPWGEGVTDSFGQTQVSTLLNRLSDVELCYILESDALSEPTTIDMMARRIAVYNLDNTLYFLSVAGDDNKLFLVHYFEYTSGG